MNGFEKVGVLGCGTMGAGIAQVVATSGRHVVVLETDESRVERGLSRVTSFLDGGVQRAKVTEDEKSAILGLITWTTSVADLAGVDLVIEAVSEDRDIKRALLSVVAGTVSAEAVLTTNTSALSISDLATAVGDPSRFAGLHFFNPAPVMSVIEIVRGLRTSDGVVDALSEFVTSLGKEPAPVKDRPGFLVNRLLLPYLNDVIQAFDEELASAEDIDVALKLGLGYKLGPLELLDMIGLDVHNAATTRVYEATLDPAYAAPPLLQSMVAAGMLGTKSGRGFRVNKETV